MKIAMAQISISNNIADNLQKTIDYIKEAGKKADFVFFPELQLTPFYPLYHIEHWGVERKDLALTFQSKEVEAIRQAAKDARIWVSPNMYMDDSFTNPLSGIILR